MVGDLDLIARGHLFARFTDAELQVVAAAARSRTASAGEFVCRQGDSGDSLYVIASGKLTVSRNVGGETVPLATLKPGDVCGEMSIATGSPRTADLVASEPSTFLEIGRSDLDQVLAEHPEIASKLWHNLATVLTERLTRTNNLVAEYVSINQRLIEDDEFRRFYSRL